MTETLACVWVPLDVKLAKEQPLWMHEASMSTRTSNKAGGYTARDGEDEEEHELDDGQAVPQLDMQLVMENELKVAGISAKKGYEELVYEATVAILGEAVVGLKSGGMQGKPEERLWCKADCPGCSRELKESSERFAPLHCSPAASIS